MIIRYLIFYFLLVLIFIPLLILSILLVWSQDGKNPFYLGIRVGKKKSIQNDKTPSMKFNADKGQLIPQSLMTINYKFGFLFVDTRLMKYFSC